MKLLHVHAVVTALLQSLVTSVTALRHLRWHTERHDDVICSALSAHPFLRGNVQSVGVRT